MAMSKPWRSGIKTLEKTDPDPTVQTASEPGVRRPVSGSLRVKLTRSWRNPRGKFAAIK